MRDIYRLIRCVSNVVDELVFPPACVLCGELLDKENRFVCEECQAKISYIKAPVCLKCGKEIKGEDNDLCEDCRRHSRTYIKGFPAINYDELFSTAIAEFKYKNRRDYAKYFAYEILKTRGREIAEVLPDVLIPVPVHRKKQKTRGYNQAELLANELGKFLHIPVDSSILSRQVNTLPQKQLDNEARENNLKNAFISNDGIVKYKKIMLVDDIYTTGATIEACTRALYDSGAAEVYYTSICIGRGY